MAIFETVRFGALEHREEDVIRLRDGLIGMPDLRRWILLEMEDGLPMKWLQSLDRADFGFPVMDPYFYCDNFDAFLPRNIRSRFGLSDDAELAIMIVTTIHAGGTKMTGNLLAPLIISTDRREGAQIPLDEKKLNVRVEIDYFKFGLAVQSTSAENGQEDSGKPSESSDAELHHVNAP